MKVKGLLKFYLPAVAVAMGVGSCQDYNADFSEEALRKEQFAEQFAKDFGKIDPNHDWSMAGRFTANVNLDSKVEGVLSIYTKEPGLDGSYLLAKAEVKEGRANVEFDAIKGTDLLYAVIQKNGRNIVASNYDVVNNTITLGHLATRALTTTAAEDDVSISAHTIEVKDGYGNISNPTPWRMSKTAVEALVNSGYDSYKTFGEGSDGYHYSTGTDPHQLNAIAYENLYKISNNHEEHGAEYTMEQLWKIFGKKKSGGSTEFEIEGVFQEGEDHVDRYVKTGILAKDASLVVAEDGPVSMELIWRGTDYYDVFGYFFYPENGDPITAEYLWSTKKYILFGDDLNRSVGGSSDLTQVSHWNDQLNGGAGGYGEWSNLSGMLAQNTALGEWGSGKTKMRGTKMWLVNFDESGNPTYEFKKGTKLGFFMYSPHINQLVFSDTKLNYQLNYSPYKKGLTGEEDNDQSRPYAVTFNYKGSTLLGFADGCGDYDINDVVFGAFNVEEVPDITPDEPEPEAQTWVVACEDLGGTFDYDFNDLVFGLRMTPNLDVSTSKLELIPLAAGGTLEANVIYNDNVVGEMHHLLIGESASTETPYNVSEGSSPSVGKPVVLEKSIASTTPIDGIAGLIKVQVKQESASNIFIQKCQYDDNKAPQMILFPTGWDWPSEGTDIRSVYEEFAYWVADESKYVDWYKHKKDGSSFVNSPMPKVDSGNSGGNGEQGDGGDGDNSGDNTITPSGKTTYTGDDLAALLDNGKYVIPSSACQTKTSCTVIFTFTPSNDYVQMDAWTAGDNDWTWLQIFEGQSATQMQLTGMVADTEYSYSIKSAVFNYINKNGMNFKFDYGTITSITIIAE